MGTVSAVADLDVPGGWAWARQPDELTTLGS
jgi:hypothetical protein